MTQQFIPQVDVREPRGLYPHRTCPQMLMASGIQNGQKWKLFKDRLFPNELRKSILYFLLLSGANAKTYSTGTRLVHIQDSWPESTRTMRRWSYWTELLLTIKYFSPLHSWHIEDGILRWDHIPKSSLPKIIYLCFWGSKSVGACVTIQVTPQARHWRNHSSTNHLGQEAEKAKACYFQESSIL